MRGQNEGKRIGIGFLLHTTADHARPVHAVADAQGFGLRLQRRNPPGLVWPRNDEVKPWVKIRHGGKGGDKLVASLLWMDASDKQQVAAALKEWMHYTEGIWAGRC
ncbi:hypothetical protein GCM10011341_38540 [Frigidibacter albus]|nr:hypothetical protein GCM10011341_38540 [Frigidibacter albus]